MTRAEGRRSTMANAMTRQSPAGHVSTATRDDSLMPQRGYGLQPRVATSATLGKEGDLVLNRNAVASVLCISC